MAPGLQLPHSMCSTPTLLVTHSPHLYSAAYTEELGAVGGACLEEEAGALRLEEDSEHPPMILRTD